MQCNVIIIVLCLVSFNICWFGFFRFHLFFHYLDYGICCIVLFIVVLRFVLNYIFVFISFDSLGFDCLGFCLILFRLLLFWLVMFLFALLSFGFICLDGVVWNLNYFFIFTGGSTVDWNSVKDRNRLLVVSIFNNYVDELMWYPVYAS